MAIGNESNLIEDEFVEIHLDEVDVDNVMWDFLGNDNRIKLSYITRDKDKQEYIEYRGVEKWWY
jgi:hypothetical protein